MQLARPSASIRFMRLPDHPFFINILRRHTSELDTVQYFDQVVNDWVTTALIHPIPISEDGHVIIRLHGQPSTGLDQLHNTMDQAFRTQHTPVTATNATNAVGPTDWRRGRGRKTSDDDPHLRWRQAFEDMDPIIDSPAPFGHNKGKQRAHSPTICFPHPSIMTRESRSPNLFP
jgi:hypothetical protein